MTDQKHLRRTSWRSRTDVDVRTKWTEHGWVVECHDCGWDADRYFPARWDAADEARWHVDTHHHCVCAEQPLEDSRE